MLEHGRKSSSHPKLYGIQRDNAKYDANIVLCFSYNNKLVHFTIRLSMPISLKLWSCTFSVMSFIYKKTWVGVQTTGFIAQTLDTGHLSTELNPKYYATTSHMFHYYIIAPHWIYVTNQSLAWWPSSLWPTTHCLVWCWSNRPCISILNF